MANTKMYRALTEVHITTEPGKRGDKAKGIPPVKPVVSVIPAKGFVELDPENEVTTGLLRDGGIKLHVEETEKVAATPASAAKPTPKTKATPAGKKPAAPAGKKPAAPTPKAKAAPAGKKSATPAAKGKDGENGEDMV